jgi:hypothetical protein
MPAAGSIVREISSAVTLIGVAVALQRKKKTVPVSATYNFPRVFCPECAFLGKTIVVALRDPGAEKQSVYLTLSWERSS